MKPTEIKKIRDRLKLTQIQFAELLGACPQSIWRWEADRAKPTAYQEAVLHQLTKINPSKKIDVRRLMLAQGPIYALGLLTSQKGH